MNDIKTGEVYTSTQARAVLGNITGAKLARLVARGDIQRIPIPGQKIQRYSKEDVDRLAAELREWHQRYRQVS